MGVSGRAWPRVAAVAAVSAGVGIGAVSAWATVTSTAASALVVATAKLQPPASVTTQTTCGGSKKSDILVSWAASTSPSVSGYQVTRATNGGAAVVIATVASTATSYDDTTITGGNTYVYGVATTLQSWTSGTTTAPAVSTPRKC